MIERCTGCQDDRGVGKTTSVAIVTRHVQRLVLSREAFHAISFQPYTMPPSRRRTRMRHGSTSSGRRMRPHACHRPDARDPINAQIQSLPGCRDATQSISRDLLAVSLPRALGLPCGVNDLPPCGAMTDFIPFLSFARPVRLEDPFSRPSLLRSTLKGSWRVVPRGRFFRFGVLNGALKRTLGRAGWRGAGAVRVSCAAERSLTASCISERCHPQNNYSRNHVWNQGQNAEWLQEIINDFWRIDVRINAFMRL